MIAGQDAQKELDNLQTITSAGETGESAWHRYQLEEYFYGQVKALGLKRETCEDVLGKAKLNFITSFQNTNIKNPRAFGRRIIRNALLDVVKKQDREKQKPQVISLTSMEDRLVATEGDPDVALAKMVFWANFRLALQFLKPKEASVIAELFLNNHSMAQLAIITKTQEGTLRGRRDRGLKQLYSILKEDEGFLDAMAALLRNERHDVEGP